MTKKNPQDPSSDATDLEQIRQILIGAFSRDVDARFQHLAGELERLNRRMTEQFEATADRITEEVKSLRHSITSCSDEGEKKRDEIQQRLTTAKHELHQQLDTLSNTLAATEQSMRHDMNHGMGKLKSEIREQLDDINQRMRDGFSQLGESSLTRTSFRDALRQLSSQFEAEDIEAEDS